MEPWLVVTIIIAVVVVVMMACITVKKRRGWQCTERGCEYVIGGEHASPEKCESRCRLPDEE